MLSEGFGRGWEKKRIYVIRTGNSRYRNKHDYHEGLMNAGGMVS